MYIEKFEDFRKWIINFCKNIKDYQNDVVKLISTRIQILKAVKYKTQTMRQTLIILICTIQTISAFGQATKEVTKKYKNPWYTEKYSVLKSDKKVKHGNFQKLGYEDCLVIDGYFDKGKKDSLWTNYYWRSKQIEKQGLYKNDKRIGEWKFYSSDGTLIQTYDYTNQKIVYSIRPTKEVTILQDGKETEEILLSNPQFIGSTIELYDYIKPTQMEMAKSGEYDLKTGMVIITFYVTEDGKAIDHKIESGISVKIDQKCLEIVKDIPDLWVPGKDENGIVVAKYTLPINFRIN